VIDEGFSLEGTEELTFHCGTSLAEMYKLSPYVWSSSEGYQLLLRVVNVDRDPAKKVARIHAGRSRDGVRFELDDVAVVSPSPDPAEPDSGGCEDPTVACVDEKYYVYYTGWNELRKEGTLLLATGNDVLLHDLVKSGVAVASSDNVRNPKEATIVRAADGGWLLFMEFARGGRSRIGVAESERVDGPWGPVRVPFDVREDSWDSWHLSPGPIVETAAGPVMFYNGATREAAWRVGWLRFDSGYRHVVARCDDPVVTPGRRRSTEDTDIAFAASAVVENGRVILYYSVADRYCIRASLCSRDVIA
jgi:beta-1,2-mannobiose phosphorylase / 1,2-beta-oligomannan phosphorylase